MLFFSIDILVVDTCRQKGLLPGMAKTLKFWLFFVAIAGFFTSVGFAARNGNLEHWQEIGVDFDINEDWKFAVTEELKLGEHNGNPYLHNTDMGLVYKSFGDWIDVSLNFKKEYEKDSAGKFRHENRPHINIMLYGKAFGLDLAHRSRLEYRDRQHKETVWRLREKFRIKLPYKFTKFNLQPYIADEIFLNLGEDNVNQNRFFAGFSGKLAKDIKINLFYMWKKSKITGGWRDTNVIGTQIRFLFCEN